MRQSHQPIADLLNSLVGIEKDPMDLHHQRTMCSAAAAAAAIAKPARPSSFLQAAGGSAPAEGSRGPQPGRGGASGAGGGRGRGRAPPRAPPVTVPNEDFDFEEMMKKFNKQAALKVGFISNLVTICLRLYIVTPMVTAI